MKEVDNNGFWRVRNNPLSKEGVFPYLGKQISADLEPNKIYKVYRPMSEISAPETIESFDGIPLIDEHEMIGEGWTDYDNRPAGGVVYHTYARDGKLYGDIRIFSEQLKDEIKNGKKELSMGYSCRYEPAQGVFDGEFYDFIQRDLRGNHVALVNRGRMGSDVRVYDQKITFDTLDGLTFEENIMEAQDKEWNEADHPRDDSNGQFIEKGSSYSNQFGKEAKQKKVAELEAKVEKALNENNKDAYEAYQNQLNIEKQSLADLEKAEMTLGKMSENEGNSELYQKRGDELKEKYPIKTRNEEKRDIEKFIEYAQKGEVSSMYLDDAKRDLQKIKNDESAIKSGLRKIYNNNQEIQKELDLARARYSKALSNNDMKEARVLILEMNQLENRLKEIGDKEIPSQDGSPKESGVDSSLNQQGNDSMEKVDKRKDISEVEAMLYEAKKDPAKLTDELIKTVLQKMENNSYEASEKTKADDEAPEEKKSEDEEKACKDGCKAKDECEPKKDSEDEAKADVKGEAPTEEKDEAKKEETKAEDKANTALDALPEILKSLEEVKSLLKGRNEPDVMYGLDETPVKSNEMDKGLMKYLGE